jgi:hypothetical protein
MSNGRQPPGLDFADLRDRAHDLWAVVAAWAAIMIMNIPQIVEPVRRSSDSECKNFRGEQIVLRKVGNESTAHEHTLCTRPQRNPRQIEQHILDDMATNGELSVNPLSRWSWVCDSVGHSGAVPVRAIDSQPVRWSRLPPTWVQLTIIPMTVDPKPLF